MMDEYKNGTFDPSVTAGAVPAPLSKALGHASHGPSPMAAKGGLTGSLLEEDGKRVEYTMTAKIELTLVGVANDTPETEEKIRKFWSGYVYAIADEANVLLPLDNLNVTEVKLFAREVPV